MIIRAIDIDTFAGLSSVRIDLAKGLNLVVGPNEAGKSTVFRVIRSLLFEPAKQNKRNFDSRLARFLTVGGGDTIAAGIEFIYNDESYRLEKEWGARQHTRFVLPSGAVVSDDLEVQDRIVKMLPAPAATVEQVFLAVQSDLAASVNRLRKNGEVFSGLSDSLRTSVLESAGVSIESFRQTLEQSISDIFGRWDRRNRMPEQGRGIDNPWKSKVGTILDAWYRAEALRRRISDLQTGEDEIRACSDAIRTLDTEYEELRVFVEVNEHASKAALRRDVIDSNMRLVSSSLATLRNDYDRWPELARERRDVELLVADLKSAIPELEKRRDAARKSHALRETRSRISRIDDLRRELVLLKQDAAFEKPITADVIADLRAKSAERNRCSDALRSGVLTLTLRSGNATEITLSRGGEGTDAPEAISLKPDETRTELIEGAGRLVHKGLEILLQSGEVDPAELVARVRDLEMQIGTRLEAFGVASIDEVVAMRDAFERARSRVESLETQIDRELSGDSYEDLMAQLEDTPESDANLEEIATTLTEANERSRGAADKLRGISAEMSKLEQLYRDREALFGIMTTKAGELERLKVELTALPDIPAGFDSVGNFITHYESSLKRIEAIREEKHRLTLEMLEFRNQMPDESSEELERAHLAANRELKVALAHGEAIGRVLKRTNELLEMPDSDLYQGIEEHFSTLIAQVTSERYTGISGWNAIPDAVRRPDGVEIGYSYLSAGTKDVFSICLRLAIAEYYTRESTGFLLMDDPLVDLDPERQRVVADLIQERSERMQLLVFTCHPSHADLYPRAHRVDL